MRPDLVSRLLYKTFETTEVIFSWDKKLECPEKLDRPPRTHASH